MRAYSTPLEEQERLSRTTNHEGVAMLMTDEAREHCRLGGKGIEKMVAEDEDLGFAKPADALGFFSNIQQQLYAA